MLRSNPWWVAVLILMTALPALVHAQTPRLTRAKAIRIAIRFSKAIGQPVTGPPGTVTYPTPPRYANDQQAYWQPCWSIVFPDQAEFEVIDATGAIAWYEDYTLTNKLANNPPTVKPLTAVAAVKKATSALKAAGVLPELASTPSVTFVQSTPDSKEWDRWDVIWRRKDPTSGILY